MVETMPCPAFRRLICGTASRAGGFLYLGPMVSGRQMDVLHGGHAHGRFSRLAATLSRRRTPATDAIRRERGRRARDYAGWQIVHHHLWHTTVHNLAVRQ